MKTRTLPTISAILVFTIVTCITISGARAALHDRGYGFIYDDAQDITWYDYAYSAITWTEASEWASTLEVYHPETSFNFNDWRLPYTYDPIGTGLKYGVDGSNTYNFGYNITSSELGHLYYNGLNGLGLYDIENQPNSQIGIQNVGPFTSILNYNYWSNDIPANANIAWIFQAGNGQQTTFQKSGYAAAMVVRDGDILSYTPPKPNRPPVLAKIGTIRAMPDTLIEFTLIAEDEDADDSLFYEAQNLPEGAYFDPTTANFSWTPYPEQEGNYNIEFTVYDNGIPVELDLMIVKIVIGDINSGPSLKMIPAQTVNEYDTLEFIVEATDPDGDRVEISIYNLPQGAFFDQASGLFSWTPVGSQTGNSIITFVATEIFYTRLQDQLDVIISVGDVVSPMEFSDLIIKKIVGYELTQELEDEYVSLIQKTKKFIATSKSLQTLNSLDKFSRFVEDDMADGIISNNRGLLLLDMAKELRGLF